MAITLEEGLKSTSPFRVFHTSLESIQDVQLEFKNYGSFTTISPSNRYYLDSPSPSHPSNEFRIKYVLSCDFYFLHILFTMLQY
jgi:hypothetical protein